MASSQLTNIGIENKQSTALSAVHCDREERVNRKAHTICINKRLWGVITMAAFEMGAKSDTMLTFTTVATPFAALADAGSLQALVTFSLILQMRPKPEGVVCQMHFPILAAVRATLGFDLSALSSVQRPLQ